ncbi:MAG: chromosomal replication initiator protein DnaA [Aggregatilineaceae bacterium]
MLTPKDAWQATLGQLQLQLNRATFETWLKGAELLSCDDGQFVIRVRHAYAKDWLEKHLQWQIVETLGNLCERDVSVNFVVAAPPRPVPSAAAGPLFDQQAAESSAAPTPPAAPDTSSTAQPQAAAPTQPSASATLTDRYSEWDPRVSNVRRSSAASRSTTGGESSFNRLFTFERFVPGPCNQFAFAAAKAVAEAPGERYNPLVIYGGVGLGKTHLLHAIGHIATANGKQARYVTAEEFTNELVTAIKSHSTEALRERYRQLDVFLLDDIQFLAGKTSSEEEFFHTFNALFSLGKQIVVSCNQHPRQLTELDDRLQSRLAGGLLADLQVPEEETRRAILKAKSSARGMPLPDEVAVTLAQHAATNVRELEGLVTQVLARAALTGQPLNAALAEQVISRHSVTPPTRRAPNLADVLQATATYHQLSLDDLLSKRRTKEVVRARQIAMYLAREETDASLPEIGAALGGRNHSTVLYGYQKIAKSVDLDPSLRREVSEIRRQLTLLPRG